VCMRRVCERERKREKITNLVQVFYQSFETSGQMINKCFIFDTKTTKDLRHVNRKTVKGGTCSLAVWQVPEFTINLDLNLNE